MRLKHHKEIAMKATSGVKEILFLSFLFPSSVSDNGTVFEKEETPLDQEAACGGAMGAQVKFSQNYSDCVERASSTQPPPGIDGKYMLYLSLGFEKTQQARLRGQSSFEILNLMNTISLNKQDYLCFVQLGIT